MSDELLSCLCCWFKLNLNVFFELRGLGEAQIWHSLSERSLLKEGMSAREYQVQLDKIYQEAKRYNILYPGHRDYPDVFLQMSKPPVFLNTVGDIQGVHESPKLAIVGARDADVRFLQWMDEHLSKVCERVGGCFISGGARGVDQKVTHIAIKNELPQIVFIPSGLGCPYPSELSKYFNQKKMGIISEYLPFQRMEKSHFVQRNRLISGLSDHVLIVQAAHKSGTMITARYAIEQNKNIATLPDFPGYRKTSGNLSLLSEGAQLILESEDLIQMIKR